VERSGSEAGRLEPDLRRRAVLQAVASRVRRELQDEPTGHDWWHAWRVRNLSLYLARREGADRYVVELAAWLHDVADWKFHGGDSQTGPKRVREWLTELGVDGETVDAVCRVVEEVSFKGNQVDDSVSSLEAAVVQDADRLDALGAVGVARAFAFGGWAGRPLHDPAQPPQSHSSFEQYRRSNSSTLNHFYEKLLLLKDRMKTATGRALAERRHRFLEQFLEEFLAEWSFAAEPLDALDQSDAGRGTASGP